MDPNDPLTLCIRIKLVVARIPILCCNSIVGAGREGSMKLGVERHGHDGEASTVKL